MQTNKLITLGLTKMNPSVLHMWTAEKMMHPLQWEKILSTFVIS